MGIDVNTNIIMRRVLVTLFVLSVCIHLVLFHFNVLHARDDQFELKVLTYNIWGWNPPFERRLDLIIRGIADLDPDLVGLQEVMESPDSDGSDNSALIIANRLEELTGKRWYLYKQNSHNFGDSVFGFGILSQFPIFQKGYRFIPRGEFDRILQWAQVETPIGFINFYNTHLSYGDQWEIRIEQAVKIKEYIQEDDTTTLHMSTIMCGDFNDRPGTVPIATFTLEEPHSVWFYDTWEVMHPGELGYTAPIWEPSMRIDYVFLKAGENGAVTTSQLVFDEPDSNGLYPSDHIGVFTTIEYDVNVFDVQLMTPIAGDTVSGTVPVSWVVSGTTEPVNTSLWISPDDGLTWENLFWNEPTGENTFEWNTQNHPDGTQYRLKVYVQGTTEVGMFESPETFAINNPGNATPEVEILSPEEDVVVSGEWLVRWFAEDADGDELTCSMYYSSDGGVTWQPLFTDLQDVSEYVWNTLLFANGPYYRLAFHCSDDSVAVSDTTETFEVYNERAAVIPTQQFYHALGNGDATLRANVIEPDQLTGDLYRITFDDSTFEYKVYDVITVDTGENLVENAVELDGVTEGPLFDGVRLMIEDRERAEIDTENTGWIIGSSTLEMNMYLPIINIGAEELAGYPYPADYRIAFFDHIVDTSSAAFGAPAVPMMFKVWNITESKEVNVIFSDFDDDQTLSRLDEIFILEEENDESLLTWAIFIGGQPNAVVPRPGDMFVFRTLKPLSGEDVHEFRATLTPVDVAWIEVTPEEVILLLRDEQQFEAEEYGVDGLPIVPPITPLWSTDGGVITSEGLYTATTAGDFRVTAAVADGSVEGTAMVHVLSCTVYGDGNDDGVVDVSDVLSTVNYIIGYDPEPFHVSCVDCNDDGHINIFDVVGLVSVILGYGTCGP